MPAKRAAEPSQPGRTAGTDYLLLRGVDSPREPSRRVLSGRLSLSALVEERSSISASMAKRAEASGGSVVLDDIPKTPKGRPAAATSPDLGTIVVEARTGINR
jgi:hypothetical protein